MITRTSYYKAQRFWGLYRQCIRRNRGYFVLTTLIGILFFPLQFFFTVTNPRFHENSVWLLAPSQLHTAVSSIIFPLLVMLFPFILSLMNVKYMHNKMAVDTYHALPVTREALLLVNLSATITITGACVVINYLLTMLLKVIYLPGTYTAYAVGMAFWEIFSFLVVQLAIIAIVGFVAVCVGNVFENFVFSGILLVFAPICLAMTTGFMDSYLLGFSTESFIKGEDILLFSPITMLYRSGLFESLFGVRPISGQQAGVPNLVGVLIWLVIAAALLVVACLIYSHRKSEAAGQNDTKGVLAIAIKLIVSFIAAGIFGAIFSSVYDSSRGMFVFGVCIGTLIVYFIAEVILARGFKTILKAAPIGVGTMMLYGILAALLVTGGAGYQQRVPAVDQVASVVINYPDRFVHGSYHKDNYSTYTDQSGNLKKNYFANYDVELTSPEAIEIVQKFHQSAIQYMEPDFYGGTYDEYSARSTVQISLEYRLKSGGKLVRSYSSIPVEALAALMELDVNEEYQQKTNPIFHIGPEDIETISIRNRIGEETLLLKKVDQAFAKALLEALRADIQAETLSDITSPASPDFGSISLTLQDTPDDNGVFYQQAYAIIGSGYENTIRVLQQNGYSDALEIDADQVKLVYCEYYNTMYGRISGNILTMFSHGGVSEKFYDMPAAEREKYYRSQYQSEKEYYYVVESQADIQALLSSCRNQMDFRGGAILCYFETEDDMIPYPVLLPYNLAPASVQLNFKDAYRDEMGYLLHGQSWYREKETVTAELA